MEVLIHGVLTHKELWESNGLISHSTSSEYAIKAHERECVITPVPEEFSFPVLPRYIKHEGVWGNKRVDLNAITYILWHKFPTHCQMIRESDRMVYIYKIPVCLWTHPFFYQVCKTACMETCLCIFLFIHRDMTVRTFKYSIFFQMYIDRYSSAHLKSQLLEGRSRQITESEASLVYTVSSRTAWVTHWDPASKHHSPQSVLLL